MHMTVYFMYVGIYISIDILLSIGSIIQHNSAECNEELKRIIIHNIHNIHHKEAISSEI